jgi:hypothetical protein
MEKKAQIVDIFFLRMAEDITKFYLTYYADYPFRIMSFHLQLLEELYERSLFIGLKGFELRQAKEVFLSDLQNKVNELSYICI